MNCGIMPRAVRGRTLGRRRRPRQGSWIQLNLPVRHWATEACSKRAKASRLSPRVDLLTPELAQLKMQEGPKLQTDLSLRRTLSH